MGIHPLFARKRFAAAVAAVAAVAVSGQCAQAAARTWVGSASTDWATLNGFNAVPATGDSLTFGADGTAGTTAGHVLTNTLTSTGSNIAGITFNAGAPAYSMNGNTFTLTTGITNSSSNVQTFNNTGISGTPVTAASTAGLTTAAGLTFNTGAGLTLSGLQFTMTGTTGVTTTVNGTGTMTIGVVGLDIGSGSRIVQSFNGSAPIVVTTVNTGGATSATNNSFGYAGTGSFTLNGVANPTSFGDFVSSGTFNLNGTISAGLTSSGSGVFNESATGVLNGGTNGSFTQGSTGTSTLSGTNTYTGATTVTAGTLLLDHSASGAPASNIIGSANTALTLGGGTLAVGGNSNGTYSDKFNGTTFTTLTSSAISATQNGASVGLTLGALTRGAQSTLDVTPPTAGGGVTTSSTNFVSNSVLVSAAANGIAFTTANGQSTWATNSSGTIGALASYQTNYTAPASNIDVGSADAPSSAFTVNTLRFNSATAALTAQTGTNTISTGGILVTNAATGASLAGGNIQSGGGKELVIINNGSLTVGSIIQNNSTASTLTLSGTGTTTLSAANTFSGQTALLGGTLKIANSLALQNSVLQINAGAAFAFDPAGGTSYTLGGLSGSATATGIGAVTSLTLGNSAGNNPTYTGAITGTGLTLTKVGSNTQNLGGTNTYTGSTNIIAGDLRLVTTSGVLPSGSTINLGAGSGSATATLEYSANNGSPTYTNPINVLAGSSGTLTIETTSGVVSFNGPVSLANNVTLLNNNNSINAMTFGNSITGTGNVTVDLSQAGGIIINNSVNNAGTISYIDSTARANTVGLTISGTIGANVTGLIVNHGSNQTGANQAPAIISHANNPFFGDTTLTLGVLQIESSTALQNSVLVTNSTAGTVLFGTSSTVGLTSVTLGGLAGNGNVGLSNTLATPGAVALTIGNSNASNGSTANPNTLNPVYSGILSDGTATGASVTKVGSNTQTFSGPNTYTGNTTINAGKLSVAASGSISTASNVAVASGAELNVLGTVGGAVTLSSGGLLTGTGTTGSVSVGGTISPGASGAGSVGTLTSTTAQAWAGGGAYVWDLVNPAGATPGTDWDVVQMSTLNVTATSGNTFTITIQASNGVTPNQPYTIAHAASVSNPGGTFDPTAFVLPAPPLAGESWQIQEVAASGGGFDVQLTETPEPGAAGLLAIAAVGLLRRRRRA